MRNTRWLRYGLASIIVAGTGLGASLTACGDDDSGSSSSGNLPETGTPDSPGADTAVPDAPIDAPKPNFAKLTFINALTDMGAPATTYLNGRGDTAIRICFKQGTTAQNLGVAPYPPLPDKPRGGQPVAGVLPGTGGTFPSFGLDLEGRIIVPIIMNVKTLVAKGVVNPGNGQPGTTCDELVGDTKDAAAGLVENVDYWTLPQIDAGTFKKEKSYVLALTGCVGDANPTNQAKCGPGFTAGGGAGNGNMKVTIFETNTTPVSATQLGVQLFHASAQADAVFGAAAIPLTPGFMSNPNDAGTFKAAVPAPIVLNTLTPAQGVTGVTDTNFFVLDKTNPGNPLTALAPFPLPTIQALSGLGTATAPTVYKDGANFVFLVVGDPQEPTFSFTDGGGAGDGGDGTSFNTKSLHYLAFPTDPVIAPYTP
jgi:hypothetical protein